MNRADRMNLELQSSCGNSPLKVTLSFENMCSGARSAATPKGCKKTCYFTTCQDDCRKDGNQQFMLSNR